MIRLTSTPNGLRLTRGADTYAACGPAALAVIIARLTTPAPAMPPAAAPATLPGHFLGKRLAAARAAYLLEI